MKHIYDLYALVIWILNNPIENRHIIRVYPSKEYCMSVAEYIKNEVKDQARLFCSPLTPL